MKLRNDMNSPDVQRWRTKAKAALHSRNRALPNEYHAHLDVCSWCRHHPFSLCQVGLTALKAEATK